MSGTNKRYTVRVEWYSLEPHCVGDLTGERKDFGHRTLKAAKRRLGSLIAGKQQHLTKRYRLGTKMYIIAPDGEQLTWTEARNIIEEGAR